MIKLNRVLVRRALLLGPLMIAAGATAAPPPVTSAELTSALAACPDFKLDAWLVVDQLHDRLIADWRALPSMQSASALQRSLELRFADDLGAASGISAESVATLKLAMEEAWLRRRLKELQVKTCIPATDEVVEVPGLRQRPEVANQRTAAIRALQILVAESERQVARGESPRSMSVLAPSDAEMVALRSFAKCIESVSDAAGHEETSKMRERLSAAIARAPRDLALTRANVILRCLPGLDAQQSDCVRQWLEGQRALRIAALAELAALVMKQDGDVSRLTELLHRGTGELGALAEVSECLPEDTVEVARALLGHWDALPDPVSAARVLIGDRGASELLELEPASVTPVPIADVVVRLPSGDLAEYEHLWRSILARDLGPAETERLRTASAHAEQSRLPKLRQMLAAIAASESSAESNMLAITARARLAISQAQADAVRAIIASEVQLTVDWPNGGAPEGADSLVRLERLSDAFAAIPLSHIATVGMQYPQAVSPRLSIEQSGLSQADRAKALQLCTDHSAQLLQNYKELVLAVMVAYVHDAARALDRADADELPDPGRTDLRMPKSDGKSRPDEAECWRSVRTAWDAWLRECEAMRKDLRSALPASASDAIIARWLLACFPVLRDITDVHELLGPAAEQPTSHFQKLVISNLRDLELSTFAKRTTTTWSEPSADVARITAVLQQLRFDSDNLNERARRVQGPPRSRGGSFR